MSSNLTALLPHRAPYLFVTGIADNGAVLARAPDHPAQWVEVCAQAIALTEGRAAGETIEGVLVGVRRFVVLADATEGTVQVTVARRAALGAQQLFRCEVRGPNGVIARGDLAVARTTL